MRLIFDYEWVAPERLDRAITEMLKREQEGLDLSRTKVQMLIASGRVSVDGKIASKSAAISGRHTVEIDFSPEDFPREAPRIEPVPIPLSIIYEDDDLLVLNKPKGISVHPSSSEKHPTILNAIAAYLPEIRSVGPLDRPGIVHRLDKATSGLLMIAKTARAHQRLSLALKERRVEKTYLAIIFGSPSTPTGVISTSIARDQHQRTRFRAVRQGARKSREALSLYRLTDTSCGPNEKAAFSLLQIQILTGRTHQIRVHLASQGLFVLGDKTYSPRINGLFTQFLADGKISNVPRGWKVLASDPSLRLFLLNILKEYPGQFLHSWRLSLLHPTRENRLNLEAQPPPYFEAVWHILKGDYSAIPGG